MRYPEEDEIMTNTTEYVIRYIAVECGITSSHTRGIIEEAIQRGVMSSDLALRREMLTIIRMAVFEYSAPKRAPRLAELSSKTDGVEQRFRCR